MSRSMFDKVSEDERNHEKQQELRLARIAIVILGISGIVAICATLMKALALWR